MTDIRQLGKSDNVTLFFYSEFGRRAMDNGSGTDHGTGGVAFVLGDHVKGGLYGEYPSLEPNKLEDGGNLQHNVDFRSSTPPCWTNGWVWTPRRSSAATSSLFRFFREPAAR